MSYRKIPKIVKWDEVTRFEPVSSCGAENVIYDFRVFENFVLTALAEQNKVVSQLN
jgi:hypothetical protein